MVRTIHCTVVEVPAMSDPFFPDSGGFRDLVPWADPYIAALLERLRRAAADEESEARARDAACELPPPLDTDNRGDKWQADWSPRNWPRG
jgi:hypothetical protein